MSMTHDELRFPAAIPVLRAGRVELRPFVEADAGELEALIDDAEVAAGTLTIPHPYPRGSGAPWIAGHAASCQERRMITWAITSCDDGRLLGALSLRLSPAHRRAEAGYWIARRDWGNGFASEALRRVIAFAFDEVGLHRVDAHHFVENAASGAVMRRAGMRSEGVRREAVFRDGRPRSVEEYAILRSDPRA
jgi:ribosomal-protein-alanine N-acetyltransferase